MHIYHILLWYERVLFTNKVWEFNSIAQPSFVRVSLSISELHKHAYSHFSLLCGAKRLFTKKLSRVLSPTCLPSFIHPSI